MFRGEVVRALVAKAAEATGGLRRSTLLAPAAVFLVVVAAVVISKIPRSASYRYSSGLLDEVEFIEARTVVLAAVGSADSELALQGIHAIGLGENVRDVTLLVKLADQEPDPFARAEVAWAPGRIAGATRWDR